MPADKRDDLSRSGLPRTALTDIELIVKLDRISQNLLSIDARMARAEANDERFGKMEHDFRVAKWMAMIAGGAAILALANGIFSRFSWRTDAPPPMHSNADRMGSDRVPAP